MKAHIEMVIWPPSGNHYHYKNRVKTREARIWEENTDILLRGQRIPKFTKPVTAVVRLFPPNRRIRDGGNVTKPMWDAIVRAKILPDDSNRYIKSETIVWEEPVKNGLITIDLEEYGDD